MPSPNLFEVVLFFVIDETKAASVYVFGGRIDEDVQPTLVSADGTVATGGYPWAPTLDGGFTHRVGTAFARGLIQALGSDTDDTADRQYRRT